VSPTARAAKARPAGAFRVLPRGWVVERTFAWLGQSRRLSKDYERLPATSEAMIDGAGGAASCSGG
jgi:putative transposase